MLLLPPQTTPFSLHIHILIHHTLPLASPLARKHCGVSKLQTSLSEPSIVLCILWTCRQNPLLHNSQRNNNMNTTLIAVYLCNASSVWCHFQGSACNSTSSIVALCDLKLGIHIHKSDMFRNRGTVSMDADIPPVTSRFLCSEPLCSFCGFFSCCSSFWISCWKKSLSCSRSTACSWAPRWMWQREKKTNEK